ncbi:MAG: hypothetical protein JST81_07505 [Bacteroidetes bacterium]|nr:hypothetical protein [Bacteroidota bacterium]
MKRNLGILIGLTAVAVAGIIIYRNRKQMNENGELDRLKRVSDEGYETAHDVLFPKRRDKKSGLRFGPVIPNN